MTSAPDDTLNPDGDDTNGDAHPDDSKPGFIEKLKDLFTPDDDAPGKHTTEDWEVSTLESGSDQGPH